MQLLSNKQTKVKKGKPVELKIQSPNFWYYKESRMLEAVFTFYGSNKKKAVATHRLIRPLWGHALWSINCKHCILEMCTPGGDRVMRKSNAKDQQMSEFSLEKQTTNICSVRSKMLNSWRQELSMQDKWISLKLEIIFPWEICHFTSGQMSPH